MANYKTKYYTVEELLANYIERFYKDFFTTQPMKDKLSDWLEQNLDL